MPLHDTTFSNDYFPEGYIVSREAGERYALPGLRDDGLDLVARARYLAERLNRRRDFSRPETVPARAGELLALGLLTEALRRMVTVYCQHANPGVFERALHWVSAQFGATLVERPIPAFVSFFPPDRVLRGGETEADFLEGESARMTHREVTARELLLLHLNVENRAVRGYRELHDDSALKRQAPYEALVNALSAYLLTQPEFPSTGKNLLDMLRAPMLASPDSIEGQLAFILENWQSWLPPELLERLLLAEGVIREETVMRGFGTGEAQALTFGQLAEYGYEEFEAFTPDRAWMPNLVLIAKSTYVWLDQLSKHYLRPIVRLDQIPDAELDQLASWGFSGLWLIGVWERSTVSSEIKRRMGNPEALASAYSLYDYVIAADLGGEAAYRDLAARAWKRGIRLASDMVPNHMGIHSKWVVEHPDWFIQSPHPPYPSYTFHSDDLSPDARVALRIEDGYWDRRDAAVVFQRVDTFTGDVRYLYHGNDGTNMPWNDTAQLNFLIPEVREAVIQTILYVARLFPIIRFDAAMTLAKRHYQRLWFPKPGDAGAVPSRAEHGMSKAAFDEVFPNEFWREVVDRIAAEAPDTLLLAEAFWLMEGYFVRTLGMHRVYNSAFMNMLKLEENSKYRQTIKNVLEFSPEVLQRFVNFMNNPDEETAVAQFGKGDKYLGIAGMMATMPGLPMFGHGQIEGFTEKYGMEYRRAYWDEAIDWDLVHRHEDHIFPLIRKRHIFSSAGSFAFFDFTAPEGWVDENVFVYTNRAGNERALIVYNNAYTTPRGTIRLSTAINAGSVEEPCLVRRGLGEALALNTEDTCYYIARDHRAGLEYLFYARDLAENGFALDLGEYQFCAFTEWRELHDFDFTWGKLHEALGGRGVPSVDDAYQELNLKSLLEPFRRSVNAETISRLAQDPADAETFAHYTREMTAFLDIAAERLGDAARPEAAEEMFAAVAADLEHLRQFRDGLAASGHYPELCEYIESGLPKPGVPLEKKLAFWRIPITWALTRHIGLLVAPPEEVERIRTTSAAWLGEWYLAKQIQRMFRDLDGDAKRAEDDARLLTVAMRDGERLLALQTDTWAPHLDKLLRGPGAGDYLRLHYFGGRNYINKEQLENLLHACLLLLVLEVPRPDDAQADALMLALEDANILLETAGDMGYDLDAMVNVTK